MGYYHSFVTKVCLSRELSRSNEQAALALAGSSCSLASVAKCASHVEGRHLVRELLVASLVGTHSSSSFLLIFIFAVVTEVVGSSSGSDSRSSVWSVLASLSSVAACLVSLFPSRLLFFFVLETSGASVDDCFAGGC
jgi:hypothetical protein